MKSILPLVLLFTSTALASPPRPAPLRIVAAPAPITTVELRMFDGTQRMVMPMGTGAGDAFAIQEDRYVVDEVVGNQVFATDGQGRGHRFLVVFEAVSRPTVPAVRVAASR